jgi:hypothetical protein
MPSLQLTQRIKTGCNDGKSVNKGSLLCCKGHYLKETAHGWFEMIHSWIATI